MSQKYKMVPFAVKYNLGSITKIGYRDHDNDDIFVKVRGVVDKDDDGEEQAPECKILKLQLHKLKIWLHPI